MSIYLQKLKTLLIISTVWIIPYMPYVSASPVCEPWENPNCCKGVLHRPEFKMRQINVPSKVGILNPMVKLLFTVTV